MKYALSAAAAAVLSLVAVPAVAHSGEHGGSLLPLLVHLLQATEHPEIFAIIPGALALAALRLGWRSRLGARR